MGLQTVYISFWFLDSINYVWALTHFLFIFIFTFILFLGYFFILLYIFLIIISYFDVPGCPGTLFRVPDCIDGPDNEKQRNRWLGGGV